MTQLLDLISGRKDKTADPETPRALDRLSTMLTVGTPAGESPGADTEPACEPAPDDVVASQPDESVFQADDSASQADDEACVSSLFLPDATDAADAADESGGDTAETMAVVSETDVEDTDTADDGGVAPTDALAAVSAMEDAVRDAQQRAETQLMALVKRVKKAEAEHAAALVQVTEARDQRVEQAVTEARAAKAEADSLRDELNLRHAEELEEFRRNTQGEVVAAVAAALSERSCDHAAELARVQEDLERQQTDSLQRVGTAVIDSLERLTERIITIA